MKIGNVRILEWAKDGGPDSPVDAFFLFEAKKFASVAFLRFNKGRREAYHSHAFHAWTWFLSGFLIEEPLELRKKSTIYKRSLLPKVTKKDNIHRVNALTTSWCFTIRGPWEDTWYEVRDGRFVTLTHGRKIVRSGP
jgi:hypothetical protein